MAGRRRARGWAGGIKIEYIIESWSLCPAADGEVGDVIVVSK
jgi:hypothetical protein